jgi:hypothetical protein
MERNTKKEERSVSQSDAIMVPTDGHTVQSCRSGEHCKTPQECTYLVGGYISLLFSLSADPSSTTWLY